MIVRGIERNGRCRWARGLTARSGGKADADATGRSTATELTNMRALSRQKAQRPAELRRHVRYDGCANTPPHDGCMFIRSIAPNPHRQWPAAVWEHWRYGAAAVLGRTGVRPRTR